MALEASGDTGNTREEPVPRKKKPGPSMLMVSEMGLLSCAEGGLFVAAVQILGIEPASHRPDENRVDRSHLITGNPAVGENLGDRLAALGVAIPTTPGAHWCLQVKHYVISND